MAENDPQKWWVTMFQTKIVSQRKITDWYSFATIPVDRHFQMIIYRFQVIQTSRDHFLSIFMFLNRMSYLVHHTVNRNRTYTG